VNDKLHGDPDDIFNQAPPRPKHGGRFFVVLGVGFLLLVWSFQGAKLRPGELFEGIPQIFSTLARMLPPDFAKITEAKNYFFPENLSLTELLLPLPLTETEGPAACGSSSKAHPTCEPSPCSPDRRSGSPAASS